MTLANNHLISAITQPEGWSPTAHSPFQHRLLGVRIIPTFEPRLQKMPGKPRIRSIFGTVDVGSPSKTVSRAMSDRQTDGAAGPIAQGWHGECLSEGGGRATAILAVGLRRD